MKKYLAVLVFAILLSQVALSADSTLYVTYTAADSSIRPGAETTVTFSLNNPSSTTDIDNIKVNFFTEDGLTVNPTDISIGGVGLLKTKDISVVVKADKDSDSSFGNLRAQFNYYSPNQKTLSVNVPIKIEKLPTLQLVGTTFDRMPGPGSTVQMNITLKNNGDGVAKDIQLELGESEVFVSETNDAFVKSLGSYVQTNVPFEITINPDAEIGVYNIPITITYLDENKGTSYTMEKTFGLKVSGQHQFIITKESQVTITPGGSGIVEVRISNSGNAPINYLSAGFGNELVYMGAIDSDDYETENFLFVSSGDIGWGAQDVNFTMNYRDSFDNLYEENYPVKVVVTDPFTNIIVIIVGFVVSLIVPVIGLIVIYKIYQRFFNKKKDHPSHHKGKKR
jgi:hypothetical protein